MITEAEVVRTIREHLEGLFPKICANCSRTFTTFREYLLTTTPIGSTMSYDVQLGDWKPVQPLGTATYANCPCGNTLALSSAGMSLGRLWRLMNWARVEMARRGLTTEELLNYLREEIRKQVLGALDQGGT
jgi:hypothetical protein